MLALASSPAAAEASATFALKPAAHAAKRGYFVEPGHPGGLLRDHVTVLNVGDRRGRVRLYATDATTGQTSGAVYRSRDQGRTGVGAWIRLQLSSLTLAPGESRTVAFTIRVPSGAPSGEHLGGIVAAPIALAARRHARPGKGTFRIDVREQAIVAVQVSLPGHRLQSLAITTARPGGTHGFQALLIGLANDGNTLLKGHGTLTVTDSGGRALKRAPFALDTFVPHTRIAFPVYLRGHGLAPGRYMAHVAIRYGSGRRVSRTLPFAISRAQASEVFGSVGQASAGNGSSGPNVVLLVLGGVALLLVGAGGSALVVRRRLRAASPDPR